jgi:apolipoprotein N-acyltransferase
LARQHERAYAQLSGRPGALPRILLWPEGATLHYLELEPDALADLVSLLGPHDVLLVGGPSAIPNEQRSDYIYHNSVFAVSAAGNLMWRYDKAHLVPFGEYLPLRPLLERIGLSRLVPGEADFTPGIGPASYQVPGFGPGGSALSVGVQICYEIIFSGRVVDESQRPAFLFNPSNDAWFGAWGPPQHLAQAQMRAIEEGLPIIRATPTGISALIAPTGALLEVVPLHSAGLIDARIPAPLPATFFSRYHLWASLAFGCLILLAGVWLYFYLPPPKENR